MPNSETAKGDENRLQALASAKVADVELVQSCHEAA